MADVPLPCMESARNVVLREWKRHRAVQLSTLGGWHVCDRNKCTIINMKEYVCMQGEHIADGAGVCSVHPGAAVRHVTDVYVCREVGSVHVCDQTTCTDTSGKCTISGLSCVAAAQLTLALPPTNKRCRRKPCSVHTNKQAACILIYNLLFSRRRVANEVQRARNTLEISRRTAQRVVKAAIREKTPLRYNDLVNIYMDARQRMCYTRYMFICDTDDMRQEICMYYANIAVRVWEALQSHLPARSTFESTCAALLYAMRKGVACDGLMAIPTDRFLAYALPDAHSIKDVDISRRSLTQARNSLYSAMQVCVGAGAVTVEQLSLKFKLPTVPNVLARHYPTP